MFKNYLKTALRNIKKYRGFSFINISGLAIGMACCILILLWVQDELSYDRFHKNIDNIYRVLTNPEGERDDVWAVTIAPLSPSLKSTYPEIINSTRIAYFGYRRMRYQDKTFYERDGYFTDTSFINIFSFPLLEGDPATALDDPHSIVLTKNMVEKYFGTDNPIGKTITLADKIDLTVTAVMENVPRNSHLQFNFLINFQLLKEFGVDIENSGNANYFSYILLKRESNASKVNKKIARHLETLIDEEDDIPILSLQPLKDVHLKSNYTFDFRGHGDIKYVNLFSLIALLTLMIACINFINLSTACSKNRAKEVGLRKTFGATRMHVIRQFFSELIILTLIAFIISILIVLLLLPVFNTLSGKQLTFDIIENNTIIIGLLGIVLLTGILSGSYPSLFLSSFQPTKVLKGILSPGSKSSGFRKVLVVFQFSLSILLIICTIVVYKQIIFMKNNVSGLNKKNIIYGYMSGELKNKFELVKNKLLQNTNILNITASANLPTYGRFMTTTLTWESITPEEAVWIEGESVDYDYFKTYSMQIVQGRAFSREFSTDETGAFILNEEAVTRMGVKNPVGKTISIGNHSGQVIGVVKDYHFKPMHNKIEPLVLTINRDFLNYMVIRIRPENAQNTISSIERTCSQFSPNRAVKFNFLDNRYYLIYKAELRIITVVIIFTILAVFISCLGLFALAAFISEQRTKEIGIRKVLGASISKITILLSKEFVRWVIAANIISWPIAYYVMNKWLQNFAYHINLTILPFVLAGITALVIALFTVSWKTIVAARTNPVETMRYE